MLDGYDPVIRLLPQFKDLGAGRARAACPCHTDGEQADLWLSLGAGGKLIMRCYPRASKTPACRTDDVMRRLGLSLGYLFPDWRERLGEPGSKRPRAARKGGDVRPSKDEAGVVEDSYDYEGQDPATGAWSLAFRVLKKRFSDGSKSYPQCRPNPAYDPGKARTRDNPEWLWNMAGVTPVLYRLKELRAALADKPDRWVFVVEGEKKVKLLHDLGLCSTTHPGGVGKWNRAEYTAELKGRNVVLCVDEDPVYESKSKPGLFLCPGIDHARDVAARLLDGGVRCLRVMRFPDAPPGGGVDDWHAARLAEGLDADSVRKRLSGLVSQAVTVRTAAEAAAALMPRGEPVWPVPQGVRPYTLTGGEATPADPPAQPAQPALAAAAAPEPTPAAPPGPARSPALAALGEYLPFLKKAAPGGPRSTAEWLGEMFLAWAAFQERAVADPQGSPEVGEAALVVAAQLMRGLDALPALRPARAPGRDKEGDRGHEG